MAGDVYVCVIDEDGAQTMFPGTNPIGQSVRIGGVSYRIVGLAGEDGNLMTAMMGGSGDGSIYIPFQNALALNGKSNVTSLEVYIEDTDKTDELIEEMEMLLDNAFNNTDGAYSILNMDSLGYLSLEGMRACLGDEGMQYCTGCWSGEYLQKN